MGTDRRTDRELVEALAGGEMTAFDELYARHRDWVMALAWRFTGHEADALDVLQETFAYLVRKARDRRSPLVLTAAMTTFLYPAVRNLAIAARRKRRRYIGADLDVDIAVPEAPPQSDRADLAGSLKMLPVAQREVVLMRFVDDLSLEEIAGALGIPVGTVKSRLHLAVKTLREDPRVRSS